MSSCHSFHCIGIATSVNLIGHTVRVVLGRARGGMKCSVATTGNHDFIFSLSF